jgi:hypothetical protein
MKASKVVASNEAPAGEGRDANYRGVDLKMGQLPPFIEIPNADRSVTGARRKAPSFSRTPLFDAGTYGGPGTDFVPDTSRFPRASRS